VVDLAQLIFSIRPAIRTEMICSNKNKVTRWAHMYGLFPAIDNDGFLVLSKRAWLSRQVMAVDRTPGNHTYSLGRMLGHPRCCCLAAAAVGDETLDRWAAKFDARKLFGRFKAIDPRGYSQGHALISHIPCSQRYLPSLRMAEALLHGLR
jgi:hypothetical protein